MSDHDAAFSDDVDLDTIVARHSTGEVSEPFWSALADGRLAIPRCRDCNEFFFFPRRWCPQCWSENLEWVDTSGTGTIFSLTKVHLAFPGVDEEELPITVLLVDLEEGVRIPGRLDSAAGKARVGDRVQLRFADDPAHVLPRFVLAV